jgi:hypothetical protein
MVCGDYQRAVDGLNNYRGLYFGKGRIAEAFWVESNRTGKLFRAVQVVALSLLSIVARRGD